MVVTNRRDHRNDRVDGVGRIQAAAETGLEDNYLASALLEMNEGQGRGDFKKGGMRLPAGDQFPD